MSKLDQSSNYRSRSVDDTKTSDAINIDFKTLGDFSYSKLESGSGLANKFNLISSCNKEENKLNSRILGPHQTSKDYGTYDDNDDHARRDSNDSTSSTVSISELIGAFGWFQLLVLLFSGLREGSVGYDAVIMSVVLQPEPNFLCVDGLVDTTSTNGQINASRLGLADDLGRPDVESLFNETNQCFRWAASGDQVKCETWAFPEHQHGSSLIAQWSLVCHRHWLVAFIESAYFLGLVSGNLTWGYLADRIGRRSAYLIAHTIGLLAGWLSIFMPNIVLFSMCRFLAAFGSIGYNIIYSIQVEIIGTKYRAFSTVLNHLGWGLGVICVPLASRISSDYRHLLAVSPVIALVMYPWAFWLPESSRWLMAQGEYERAKDELIRAAKFNGRRAGAELEKKISLLNDKISFSEKALTRRQSLIETNGEPGNPYKLIFANSTYLKDTLILSFLSFNGHLIYYMLTINFAYTRNLSKEANFISSGAGEWVSVVVGAVLLKLFPRRACMSLFATLMCLSFVIQAVADLELIPWLDDPIPVTANNTIGTLAALLLIFVTLIVNQEVYPTIMRQTGSSIVNTLGESGSTISPLAIQLSIMLGSAESNFFFAFVCLLGAIAAHYVSKTDDIELQDV